MLTKTKLSLFLAVVIGVVVLYYLYTKFTFKEEFYAESTDISFTEFTLDDEKIYLPTFSLKNGTSFTFTKDNEGFLLARGSRLRPTDAQGKSLFDNNFDNKS